MEFGFVLPVLAALLLGILTGGMAYNAKISLTNAVREGARLGATLPANDNYATTVRNRVAELSGGEVRPENVCVRLVRAPDTTVRASGACTIPGEPAVPSGVQDGECVVKVWGRRIAQLEAFFFTIEAPLRSAGVARYERADWC